MERVIQITRHRQWRAWQFGRRHSGGLFGGGGGVFDGRNDPPAPWWFIALFVGSCIAVVVLLLIAPSVGRIALCVLMLLVGLAIIIGILRN